jgi:peroxiredoxin
MKKYLFLILAFAAAAISFKSNNGGLKVGTQAPAFTLKDINGHDVKLSDYKGKIVLIDFWGSWCKQCRLESPKLVKVYQKYHASNFENGNGFEIISVAMDDDMNDWKNAVTQDGFTWANVSEGKKWDAEIAKSYMVTSLPTNYLIDGTGKIIEKDLRGQALENMLVSIKK